MKAKKIYRKHYKKWLDKHYGAGNNVDAYMEEHDYYYCVDAMREFARIKCKEQRSICEKLWLDANIENQTNHQKMITIRNASEPEIE